MKTVKCRQCKQEIDKNLAIAIAPRIYVCSEECKNQYESIKAEKKLEESKKEARKKVVDYFVEICSNDSIDLISFNAQFKRMMSNNPSFTYQGVHYTLWYIRFIENKPITNINIVPYYYEKAMKYNQKIKSIKNNICNSDIDKNDVVTICRKREQKEVIFD